MDCKGAAIQAIHGSDSRGQIVGSAVGILATTAQNCSGSSSGSGTGMVASNASFCTGSRSGGRAIEAIIGTGCIAIEGTNKCTIKFNMP